PPPRTQASRWLIAKFSPSSQAGRPRRRGFSDPAGAQERSARCWEITWGGGPPGDARGSAVSRALGGVAEGRGARRRHEGRRDRRDGQVRSRLGVRRRAVIWLGVVVEEELVGYRAEPYRVDLALAFVIDPGLDDVTREHVAAEQELAVALERGERFV